MKISTEANIEDSQQNAFVQDWLSKWRATYTGEVVEGPGDQFDDSQTIESAIELIQGTYNYQDHEARKNAVATGGDIDATLNVLSKLLQFLPEEADLYRALNLTYAFVNATKQIAQGEN